MINVIGNKAGGYTITMDKADKQVIARLAERFSVPNCDMVTAVINRGMDSLCTQVKVEKGQEGESHGCPHSG